MIIGSRLKERLLFVSPLQSVRSPRISKSISKAKAIKQQKKTQQNKVSSCLCCCAVSDHRYPLWEERTAAISGGPAGPDQEYVAAAAVAATAVAAAVIHLCLWSVHWLTCCPPAVLEAMRDDSDKVPSLLTDYILKGELHCFSSPHPNSVEFFLNKMNHSAFVNTHFGGILTVILLEKVLWMKFKKYNLHPAIALMIDCQDLPFLYNWKTCFSKILTVHPRRPDFLTLY